MPLYPSFGRLAKKEEVNEDIEITAGEYLLRVLSRIRAGSHCV